MTSRSSLIVLLLGTALLGLLFLNTILPGYGPDEPSHFGYVRHLAEGQGLPVLRAGLDPSGPSYESHQPPLYYALAVPFYGVGRMMGGERGAWVAVRLFTLLCGLLTVALVYGLARRLFPDDPAVAVGAGAFAGWLPSQAALFAVVNNDPLTELGFTLTFLLLARYLLSERRGKWDAAWFGLSAGLTFLTKASAFLLLPALPLVLLLASPAAEGGKKRLDFRPALLFGLGACVCVPWLARNQVLYGDPLGWGVFVQYFLEVHKSPTPESLAVREPYTPAWYWGERVLPWAFRDSLGMWIFSRPGETVPRRVALAPPISPPFYLAWGLLGIGAVLGMVRFSLTEWRQRSAGWRWTLTAMGIVLLLLVVAYVRLNAVFFWAHSRYLFPAVAPLALLWSVGLTRLAPPRYRLPLMWGVSGLLFFISLFAGYSVLGGFFSSIQ